jgi:hypothetical protein
MDDPENGFNFPSEAREYCLTSKVTISLVMPTLSRTRWVPQASSSVGKTALV